MEPYAGYQAAMFSVQYFRNYRVLNFGTFNVKFNF